MRIVRHAADAMLHDIGRHWTDQLRPLLAANGMHFLEPREYTTEIRAYLDEHFNATVCPVLTPLAFDPGHPFPYISIRSKCGRRKPTTFESVGRGLREVRRRPLVLLEIEHGMPQRVADILAENFQAEPDVTVRSTFRPTPGGRRLTRGTSSCNSCRHTERGMSR